jgi:uncharacterized protein DUF5666
VSAALLLAGGALAQDPANNAPSAMVSKSSEGIQPANIQPANPAPANATDDSITVDPASLLPDLPPVSPRAKATLVGGTIAKLDRVRDQVTLNVFGGGKTTALIDPRTKVYEGTKEATIADLHEGQRAYLDTIQDGNTVFAKAIRLEGAAHQGESQGVVLRYRPDRGELSIRDALSPAAINVRVNSSTRFKQGDRAIAASELQTGSLVGVTFTSEGNGRDLAREITILALPGTPYTFSGQIVHLDLRSGLLVINSSIDKKTYEIHLDPASVPDDNLHAGANVTVVANFQDSRYVARKITINQQNQ